jgi:zinc protease
MKYTTFTGNGYTGGAITKKAERTVYCCITVDLHQAHTATSSATELLYTDALLSGAGKYSREQFIDAVNLLGASIGVTTQNSRLRITLRCLEENLSKVLQLFEVMVTHPSFTAPELQRIKIQTKNELIEHTENAKAVAAENFKNSLYATGDRRHTNTPKSLISAVDTVTTAHLQKLHAITRANTWTVTVGGNQAVVDKVCTTVDVCKKGTKTQILKQVHAQKPQVQKVLLQNIPSKQNIEFSIGTSIPLTLHHPEYLPFVFGLNVLGKMGGFTGRLMSTIREKEGLTYGIYARTESVEGITSTLRELHKIQKNGITHSEYERFQTILQTQQALLADSLTGSIETLHSYLCADFSLKEIEDYRNKLMTVSRKEVNHSLKTHLHPDKITISGAGPTQKVKKEILNIKIS